MACGPMVYSVSMIQPSKNHLISEYQLYMYARMDIHDVHFYAPMMNNLIIKHIKA